MARRGINFRRRIFVRLRKSHVSGERDTCKYVRNHGYGSARRAYRERQRLYGHINFPCKPSRRSARSWIGLQISCILAGRRINRDTHVYSVYIRRRARHTWGRTLVSVSRRTPMVFRKNPSHRDLFRESRANNSIRYSAPRARNLCPNYQRPLSNYSVILIHYSYFSIERTLYGNTVLVFPAL